MKIALMRIICLQIILQTFLLSSLKGMTMFEQIISPSPSEKTVRHFIEDQNAAE